MGGEQFSSPNGRIIAFLAQVAEGGVGEADLSVSQYRLLSFLSQGSRAAAALADHMTVSRPSITSLADGLVARGLIERENDPTDRRRVLHVITAEGMAALANADDKVEACLEAALADMGGEDADAVRTGLAMLVEPFDRMRRRHLEETASTPATAAGGRS